MLVRIWAWIKRDTTSTDWAIVVLTAVIAGTSYLQWHEIRAGSTDTHTLAQAADTQAKKMTDMSTAAQGMVTQEQRIADNAKRSLDVSSKQNKAALDAAIATSRREQRAWMAISSNGFPTMTAPNPIAVPLKIQNLGKTPARHCILRARVDVAQRESDLRFDFKHGDVVNRADMHTLPPNGLAFATIAQAQNSLVNGQVGFIPFDERIADQIKRGWQVFVYGKLTYDDAFRTAHWIEFCFVYPANTNMPLSTEGPPMANCEKHNDIDNNLGLKVSTT